jgi:lactoylglutathione lyase
MRLHVHVGVSDLEKSIAFYSHLFDAEPTRRETDYAKWMLDQPSVNFAISSRAGGHAGLSHLGIQADTPAELDELSARTRAATGEVREQKATSCCYAKSDKAWATDPSGIKWEQFHTFGDADALADRPAAANSAVEPRCCA